MLKLCTPYGVASLTGGGSKTMF